MRWPDGYNEPSNANSSGHLQSSPTWWVVRLIKEWKLFSFQWADQSGESLVLSHKLAVWLEIWGTNRLEQALKRAQKPWKSSSLLLSNPNKPRHCPHDSLVIPKKVISLCPVMRPSLALQGSVCLACRLSLLIALHCLSDSRCLLLSHWPPS